MTLDLSYTVIIFLALILALTLPVPGSGDYSSGFVTVRKSGGRQRRSPTSDYPFTKAVETPQGLRYKFGVIADLDGKSRVSSNNNTKDEWISYLITGSLYLNHNGSNLKDSNITIEWEEDEPELLESGLAFNGRGQELSELIVFDNHLLTMDDRTGIVYRLIPINGTTTTKKGTKVNKNGDTKGKSEHEWKQVPWVILADGDGTSSSGFKCEWATVKSGNLWVGSHGRVANQKFVKEISPRGEVTSHDWAVNYDKMAAAVGVQKPGYIIHEAAGWNDFHKKWIFIPRKISNVTFDHKTDERLASNKIILADENFDKIELHGMAGELMPTHGVSSFKWLPTPGTNSSYILALKAEEVNGGEDQATYILAFDLDGRVLFPETKIEDNKYEGLEFL